VIHTTADFDFAKSMKIYPQALNAWFYEIKNGVGIYCDTRMIIAGVSKEKLKKYKSRIYTYVDDKEINNISKRNNTTRAIAGIDKACKDKNTKIFVIGNSPTALSRLRELISQQKVKPSLVVGVPVGFAGAEESKEEIKKTGVPFIISEGRKGGSTVAVAIINALLKLI